MFLCNFNRTYLLFMLLYRCVKTTYVTLFGTLLCYLTCFATYLLPNLLTFNFLLKETLTLLTMLAKQHTAKWKMIQENIVTDTVKRNCSQQFQLPPVFNFNEWKYWISSGLSSPKKILSATNKKFPSNDFLVHLYICQSPKPKFCF